ncbi:hypothetical protein PCANC_20663 [Puccinia coronata f. sp. avenae]|uniref:Uncharacterized protein n=1 Tax=Puccinia coronata f. sp. avenae TaxID=200324 RepID=A0A2N5UQC4_9BASI|nr:hypothetical protein PCANC_20663 [Puccinia coronata f. sp. avenae]
MEKSGKQLELPKSLEGFQNKVTFKSAMAQWQANLEDLPESHESAGLTGGSSDGKDV